MGDRRAIENTAEKLVPMQLIGRALAEFPDVRSRPAYILAVLESEGYVVMSRGRIRELEAENERLSSDLKERSDAEDVEEIDARVESVKTFLRRRSVKDCIGDDSCVLAMSDLLSLAARVKIRERIHQGVRQKLATTRHDAFMEAAGMIRRADGVVRSKGDKDVFDFLASTRALAEKIEAKAREAKPNGA